MIQVFFNLFVSFFFVSIFFDTNFFDTKSFENQFKNQVINEIDLVFNPDRRFPEIMESYRNVKGVEINSELIVWQGLILEKHAIDLLNLVQDFICKEKKRPITKGLAKV